MRTIELLTTAQGLAVKATQVGQNLGDLYGASNRTTVMTGSAEAARLSRSAATYVGSAIERLSATGTQTPAGVIDALKGVQEHFVDHAVLMDALGVAARSGLTEVRPVGWRDDYNRTELVRLSADEMGRSLPVLKDAIRLLR